MHVDILLRIRNRNALLIEDQFDFFMSIEEDTPVITRIDPGTNHKIDRTVGQFRNRHGRGGVFEDPFVGIEDFPERVFGQFDVIVASAEPASGRNRNAPVPLTSKLISNSTGDPSPSSCSPMEAPS